VTDPDELKAVDDMLDEDAELQAREAEQHREWNTYRAVAAISAGNALAYNTGHPVPVSNVLKHGYWFDGLVELVPGAQHAPAIAATLPAAEPVVDPRTAASAFLVDDAAPSGEGN
jgi:hypothetical protein